jgi:hypothetical protein
MWTMRKWRKTPSASILSVLVFGGARFVTSFNRRAQSVPRKTRAFDAGGELAHAGEDVQSAKMILFGFGVEVAFDHPVKSVIVMVSALKVYRWAIEERIPTHKCGRMRLICKRNLYEEGKHSNDHIG